MSDQFEWQFDVEFEDEIQKDAALPQGRRRLLGSSVRFFLGAVVFLGLLILVGGLPSVRP